MSSELTREQLLDYVKKQKIKIKKLETSAAEFLHIEEDLRKQLHETKVTSMVPTVGSSSDKELIAERDYLQSQLDEKSREIFAIKTKFQQESDSSKKLLSDKDETICRLQEEVRILKTNAASMPMTTEGIVESDMAEALKKKDDEISVQKSKIQKYNALVKAKLKEIETKDSEIEALQKQISISAVSVPVPKAVSDSKIITLADAHISLLIKRIECNNLKNVEVGGSISGMLGGAFGNAFGEAIGAAVGGQNDPFVLLVFDTWSLKTSTINEGGSDVAWDDLDATISYSSIPSHEMSIEVYDENNVRANVLIGSASLNVEGMSASIGELVEYTRELIDSDGVVTGIIKLQMALIFTSPGPSTGISIQNSTTDNESGALEQNNAKLKLLDDEIKKAHEIIEQRERALESTSVAMAESVKLAEEKDLEVIGLLKRMDDLTLELQGKESMLRMLQSEAAATGSLGAEVALLKGSLNEKDKIIEAFNQEGQALSKKQGEMEKIARKMKDMVKKRDTEITELKETLLKNNTQVSGQEDNETIRLQQELEHLRSSNDSMEAILQSSKEAEQIVTAEIVCLREQVSTIQSCLQSKELELAAADIKLLALTKELEDAKDNCTILKEYISSIETKNLAEDKPATNLLLDQFEKSQSDLTLSVAQLAAVEQSFQELTVEVTHLKAKLDISSKRLESSEELAGSQSKELEELYEVVAGLEVELAAFKREAETTNVHVLSNQTQITDSEEVTKLTAALATSQDDLLRLKFDFELAIKDVNSQYSTILDQLIAQISSNDLLQEELSSKLQSEGKFVLELAAVENRLKLSEDRVVALQGEVNHQHNAIEKELETKKASDKQLLEEVEKRLQICSEGYIKDIEGLETSKLIIEQELTSTLEMYKQAGDEISSYKFTIKSLEDVIMSMRAELSAAQMETMKHQSESNEKVEAAVMLELNALVNELQNKNEGLASQIIDLKMEETNTKTKITKMKKILVEKEKVIAEKTLSAEELSSNALALLSERDEFRIKLENSTLDAASARENADAFRQKLLDLEANIESINETKSQSFTSIVAIESLETERNELLARITAMEAMLQATESSFLSEKAKFQQVVDELSVAQVTINDLTAKYDVQTNDITKLTDQIHALSKVNEDCDKKLEAQTKDFEIKLEASAEKIKRLKALLTKSKQLSEDKEAQLVQKKDARPSRVVVKSRMLVEQDGWIYVYEEPSEKSRWITETQLHQWSAEGCVVVSHCEEYINISLQKKLTEAKYTYETEIDFLKTEIDENEKKFTAYKERAQLALKRLAKEEHDIQKKAEVEEKTHLKLHVAKLADLEDKIDIYDKQISSLTHSLDAKTKELAVTVESLTILEASKHDIQKILDDNIFKISEMTKTFDAEKLRLVSDLDKVTAELADLSDRFEIQTKLENSKSKVELTPSTAEPSSVTSMLVAATVTAVPINDNLHTAIHRHLSNSNDNYETSSPNRRSFVFNNHEMRDISNVATSRKNHSTSRSVLLSHADDDLAYHLSQLRDENAQVLASYNNLKSEVALIIEQENALKDNIRELESSLQRERDFNASDRKVNTDYLCNILQRFLFTDSVEEKGRLVPVICQILHFKSDQTTAICKKWVVNRRGLVGWLLPLPSPEVIDPDNPGVYDPHKDAIGSYGSY